MGKKKRLRQVTISGRSLGYTTSYNKIDGLYIFHIDGATHLYPTDTFEVIELRDEYMIRSVRKELFR